MEDKINRCSWCSADPIYQAYHDTDWGKPKYDDKVLFEMLILEGAQAGLSWITILKRRENYRNAFDNFEVEKVANYNDEDRKRLVNNAGIIRNKLKINSAIKNALVFKDLQTEFGSFSNYIWSYVNHEPIINQYKDSTELPVTNDLAIQISKDLMKRGMSFVGPVIIYSFMQSVGMINDHTLDCYLRK